MRAAQECLHLKKAVRQLIGECLSTCTLATIRTICLQMNLKASWLLWSARLVTLQLLDDPKLLKDPRVYALTDIFFLEDLKALSTTKLRQKLKELEDLSISDSFPECVREIYASTPGSDRAMRSAVVEVAKAHVRELGKKEIFKDLIREGGDFAVDYFESVLARP